MKWQPSFHSHAADAPDPEFKASFLFSSLMLWALHKLCVLLLYEVLPLGCARPSPLGVPCRVVSTGGSGIVSTPLK